MIIARANPEWLGTQVACLMLATNKVLLPFVRDSQARPLTSFCDSPCSPGPEAIGLYSSVTIQLVLTLLWPSAGGAPAD